MTPRPPREKVLKHAVPTNWLDSLLTGPEKVVTIGKPLTCPDVERLLLAVKQRVDLAVAKLLTAERRKVVRLVKKLRNTKGHSDESLCQPAYQLACDDLLAALKGER